MALSKIQLKSASRNVIINGDFRIWQRGTSHTSTATNEYSADRFRTEGNNLSTTISRQAFTAGQTDVPNFPTYYARVATSAKPSSGQYWGLMQRIEAPLNARQGQTYTLSYWVRSTSGTVAASAFTYGFGGSGASRSNSPELTTTWQKVTNTQTVNLSGGGAYLSVYIMRVPDTAPSSMSVEIANVKVEEGHVATDFEHRSVGEELELCKRYFQKYNYSSDTSSASASNSVPVNCCFNGSVAYGGMMLPVEMRTSGTFSASAANTWIFYTAGNSYTPSLFTAYEMSPHSWGMRYETSGSWGAGNAVYGRPTGTSSYWQVDAEL